MGFFAEFSAWLNALLANYIGNNTAAIAVTLEPAIVTLAAIYVMIWGYLHLTGRIEEPFIEGVRRICLLAVVLGVSLHLWLYNTIIVDSFFNAPSELAAAVVGAFNPVQIVDQIIFSGSDIATLLLQKGGILQGLSYTIAGYAVYLIVGLTAIYTVFLLSLSRIALSVLLALGPIFITLVLFPVTKRFMEAWLAQLATYAFITILTVLTAALMLTLISVAANQAALAGGGIQIAQAVRVCMAAGLTFLVMRQVMPMSASLASGFSLSTFGVLSAALGWAVGRASRGGGQFARGFFAPQMSASDNLARRSGDALRRALSAPIRALTPRRDNSLRPT